ncbi:MAG TPA: hypothetical protein DCQ64_24035 [Candidatus Rokubacteria bacterium]|nr:hypothetical protein [Candidatus Rokubacteria bacterium]
MRHIPTPIVTYPDRGAVVAARAAIEGALASPLAPLRSAAPGVPMCILSGCGWQDTGGAQRPVALARAFAAAGHPVIYCSKLDHGVAVRDGCLVTDRMTMAAAAPALRGAGGVVITTLPDWTPLVQRIQEQGWRVAYDLIDDWDGFVAGGDLGSAALRQERELVAMAELVTCSAPRLVERAQRLGAKRTALIYNGGPEDPFERPECPPCDMLLGSTQAIYSGYLYGSWFDWSILWRLTGRRRLATTVVGRYSRVDALPRVRFVGERSYADAMRYVASADVGLVPFAGSLCRSVDPIKYYDYLAAGIWTVATPDVKPLIGRPFVVTARPDEWPDAVASAARRKARPTADDVRANAWSARARQMTDALGISESGAGAGAEGLPPERWPHAAALAAPEAWPERQVSEADARLRVTWEVPATCQMAPACPYCNNAAGRAALPALPENWGGIVAGIEQLGEERGPLYLSVCYGEPTSQPDVIRAIGRLGRRNKVDVSTNLLFRPPDIAEWPRSGNIRLATSFHPHAWGSVGAFVARRREIEAAGIECGVALIVAWPPYAERIPGWRAEMEAAGITVEVLPFWGRWRGKSYPEAAGEGEESCLGRPCRAGVDYLFVAFDGTARRCYLPDAEVLGHAIGAGVRMLDKPQPCVSRICPCPDMWRYLV